VQLKPVHILLVFALLLIGTGRNGRYLYDSPHTIVPNSIADGLILEYEPVPLMEIAPERDMIGPLQYKGGLWITSEHTKFSSLSAMQIIPGRSNRDNVSLLTLSDAGRLALFETIERDGLLVGVKGNYIASLRDSNGKTMNKYNSDTEALSLRPAQKTAGYRALDQIWISYERNMRLTQYIGPFTRDPARALMASEVQQIDISDLAHTINGGAEAFATIGPRNDYILLSEKGPGKAGSDTRDAIIHRTALLKSGRNEERFHFSLKTDNGFNPTDIAIVNDNYALLLLRRWTPFSGFAIRLSWLEYGKAVPGAVMESQTIVEIRPPWTVDNFEALTVRPTPGKPGYLDLYLLSDDNGNPLQRCLLLKFTIAYFGTYRNPALWRPKG